MTFSIRYIYYVKCFYWRATIWLTALYGTFRIQTIWGHVQIEFTQISFHSKNLKIAGEVQNLQIY